MYLMYVDESGDPGLTGSPTRYFCLSGIIVHEQSWRKFIDDILTLRKTLRSVYGLPVRAEIHSAELIRNNVFGLQKHVRLAILRNSIDELAKLNYLSITNVVIDKEGKQAGYDVFTSAWSVLFQRFENTLRRGNFPGNHKNDFGIVITDATNGRALMRLVRRMAVYNFIPNTSGFSGGFRNIPITRIIEDPYGKDSKETLPIQMADIVAYFLNQRHSPNSYIKKKKAQLYFDRLLPVLNTKASRYDMFGIVKI